MRPVTPNNQSYDIPDTMRTNTVAIRNGLAANGVYPVQGATTFDTQQVLTLLNLMTWRNAGTAKWAGLNQVNQGMVVSLINYFSTNDNVKYGNARGALIDNYGQYCSYCGTPVQDTALAIEHCMPKSEFPGKMLNYDNFFLSCPSCNSNKGSKPSYVTCYAWADQYINHPPNFDQIIEGGFDRQVWPNDAYSWRGFPPHLEDADNNNQPIPTQNAIDLNNRLVSITDNLVQAIIVGYNNGNAVSIACQMGTNDFNNATLGIQEQNFIDIVDLNYWEEGNYSDRRTTNRTVAWLNILASLKNLLPFTPGTQPWQIMLLQIFSTAKNAGFFEIWASLFHAISGPNVGQNSVYLLFRQFSTDPNQPSYYFPGTDAAELPTT